MDRYDREISDERSVPHGNHEDQEDDRASVRDDRWCQHHDRVTES